MSLPSGQIQGDDPKDHYTAIVLGAGVSGMAAAIQLKEKLGLADVLVYEKSDEIGGTWNHNRYPGVGCDIPFSFYSFSFCPPTPPYEEWCGQPGILNYLKHVQHKYNMTNIRFLTMCTDARHSRADGLWHLTLKDLATGQLRHRTCNFLFSCLGGLAIPNDPPFDPSTFAGPVMHSCQWDPSVDVRDKDVVVVGNGCTAAQLVPAIIDQTRSVTQVCRSKQCILRRPERIPAWADWAMRWVPGFQWVFRTLLFFGLESSFVMSDVKNGQAKRDEMFRSAQKYMKCTAPEKYWDALTPDFDIGAKRRIIDAGYLPATNNPKFNLIQGDSVVKANGHSVTTSSGVEVPADVVVLCTGFKVRDYLSPVNIYNSEGESLVERLKHNGSKLYRGTMAAAYPSFFWIMGPNTATGHSSVIFTSECQITLAIKLIKPVLAKLSSSRADKAAAAPTVEVTAEAEDEYYAKLRAAMRDRVWEKDGGKSWYVSDGGICTTLYPWSQVNFWWNTLWPVWSHYKVTE